MTYFISICFIIYEMSFTITKYINISVSYLIFSKHKSRLLFTEKLLVNTLLKWPFASFLIHSLYKLCWKQSKAINDLFYNSINYSHILSWFNVATEIPFSCNKRGKKWNRGLCSLHFFYLLPIFMKMK